jgi:hypothetical protein
MTRNPDDWTPAVGWSNVAVSMLPRGLLGVGVMFVFLVGVFAFYLHLGASLDHRRLVASVVTTGTLIVGWLVQRRMVEVAGFVSYALIPVVFFTTVLSSSVALWVLAWTPWAVDVPLVFPGIGVVVGSLTGSLILLRDF